VLHLGKCTHAMRAVTRGESAAIDTLTTAAGASSAWIRSVLSV
jgi:hypothetical protein